MLTALELEKEIKDYIHRMYNGLFFKSVNANERLERIQKSVDDFWEQIKEYQNKHKISAVYFQELDWEGHKINAPFYSPFLWGSFNDLKIFKENKDRLLKWFLNFAKEKIEKEGYTLCQEMYDSDLCVVNVPLDLDQFEKTALEFDWVELIDYTDHVGETYQEDGTVQYWTKCFDLNLKRGYSLDIFENIGDGNSELFSLRKTYWIDPSN